MRTGLISGVILVTLVFTFPAFCVLQDSLAAEPETSVKGDRMLQLESGKFPPVPFPHHLHQAKLNECNVCHNMFPQSPGAIKDLQGKGVLEKQAVMNENCIACHKDREQAGEASGPLSCMECHIR